MKLTERRSLQAFVHSLQIARNRIGSDVTALRLLILITVALNEGLSQRELSQLLQGTSLPSLSRNLADLSTLTTKKTTGPGLLELKSDPMNLRIKRVFLTAKGRRLVSSLVPRVR